MKPLSEEIAEALERAFPEEVGLLRLAKFREEIHRVIQARETVGIMCLTHSCTIDGCDDPDLDQSACIHRRVIDPAEEES